MPKIFWRRLETSAPAFAEMWKQMRPVSNINEFSRKQPHQNFTLSSEVYRVFPSKVLISATSVQLNEFVWSRQRRKQRCVELQRAVHGGREGEGGGYRVRGGSRTEDNAQEIWLGRSGKRRKTERRLQRALLMAVCGLVTPVLK